MHQANAILQAGFSPTHFIYQASYAHHIRPSWVLTFLCPIAPLWAPHNPICALLTFFVPLPIQLCHFGPLLTFFCAPSNPFGPLLTLSISSQPFFVPLSTQSCYFVLLATLSDLYCATLGPFQFYLCPIVPILAPPN